MSGLIICCAWRGALANDESAVSCLLLMGTLSGHVLGGHVCAVWELVPHKNFQVTSSLVSMFPSSAPP